MIGVLLAAMLFASDFHDTVSCSVQGHVYKMHEADPIEFKRSDSCAGIRYELAQDEMVLYSPYIWVRIVVPAEYGHRRMLYRWGAKVAHIGPDTVPIYWGWVEKG